MLSFAKVAVSTLFFANQSPKVTGFQPTKTRADHPSFAGHQEKPDLRLHSTADNDDFLADPVTDTSVEIADLMSRLGRDAAELERIPGYIPVNLAGIEATNQRLFYQRARVTPLDTDEKALSEKLNAAKKIHQRVNKMMSETFNQVIADIYDAEQGEREISIQEWLNQAANNHDGIRVKDIIKLACHPSSSHSFGPADMMCQFLDSFNAQQLDQVTRVSVKAYGSLGATGKGHELDKAVLSAMRGIDPRKASPDDNQMYPEMESMLNDGYAMLLVGGQLKQVDTTIEFLADEQLSIIEGEALSYENGLEITIDFADGQSKNFRGYSVGGGNTKDAPRLLSLIKQLSNVGSENQMNTHRGLANLLMDGMRIPELVANNEMLMHGTPLSALEDYFNEISEQMKINIEAASELPEGLLKTGFDYQVSNLGKHLNSQWRTMDVNARLDWLAIVSSQANLAAASLMGQTNENLPSDIRTIIGATAGSSGVIPGIYAIYAMLLKPEGWDGSISDLFDEITQEQKNNFWFTCIAMLNISLKEGVAAATGGCQNEVGESARAGTIALVYGLLKAFYPDMPENIVLQRAFYAGVMSAYDNLNETCIPYKGAVSTPCDHNNLRGVAGALFIALAMTSEDIDPSVLLDTSSPLPSLEVIIDGLDAHQMIRGRLGDEMPNTCKETSTSSLNLNKVVSCSSANPQIDDESDCDTCMRQAPVIEN